MIIYAARYSRQSNGLMTELFTWSSTLWKAILAQTSPQRTAYSYYGFLSSQRTIILTYDGESYKRINSGNMSITWKDGSTSPYGERKTTIDEVFEALYLILMGICSVLIITEARQKRREKLSETPIKKKIR